MTATSAPQSQGRPVRSYDVTYDVYAPNSGSALKTVTVAATAVDMGGEYVTFARAGGGYAFVVHRDRFVCFTLNDPTATPVQQPQEGTP